MSEQIVLQPNEPKRAFALDALRGFAILTMVLSGVIPFGVLPDWMYHAQVPPPLHKFISTLPGITWVDLVFPFFLFSMGAAIPLALSKRIEQGTPKWKLSLNALKRGLLLAGFAIFDMHIRPGVINPNPDAMTWLMALTGFLLIVCALVRLPDNIPAWLKWTIRCIGWGGAISFLAFISYPNGSGFSWGRSDIIILVLSNVAFFGTVIWIFSSSNLVFRLSFLGILIAIRLGHLEVGWIKLVWDSTPFPWLYKMYYLQYLNVIIPGTIAGDLILRWMKSKNSDKDTGKKWNNSKLFTISFIMLSFIILQLIGLKIRWVEATVLISFVLCGICWYMMNKPNNDTERLLFDLFKWGAYWLVLGLFFEPYEGGIKKDHPTMSYYFLMSGLAIFLLIFFTIMIDIFNKKKWFQLLIDNGQNPMVAYAGVTNLIPPILGLTTLNVLLEQLTPTPWLGFLRGVFVTFLLALCVSYFTRKKLFLRT